MYNLLVSARLDTWNGTPAEYDRGRVAREYTSDALEARYAGLEPAAINELISFPALFAYEQGNHQPARVGWITRVRQLNNLVRIDYELEPAIPEIPSEQITNLRWDLQILEWEMNRTHWAIKDADLITALIEGGVIGEALLTRLPANSRLARATLEQPVVELQVNPSVFRVPDQPQERDLASLMMPFAAEFRDVADAVVRACREQQLRCQRGDDVWEEPEVIQDVFSLIYRSSFVICDLTGRNPNVFYEAGIAHTLGRPVIPIVQSDADVPFNLRHHRFIHYLNNIEGREQLVQRISTRLHTLQQRRR
jgi:hypothetical protein